MDNISEDEARKLLDEFARALGYGQAMITYQSYVVFNTIASFESSYLEVVNPNLEESNWWMPSKRILYATTYSVAVQSILKYVEKDNFILMVFEANTINSVSGIISIKKQNPFADSLKNERNKIEIDKNHPAFLTFKFECALRGIEA